MPKSVFWRRMPTERKRKRRKGEGEEEEEVVGQQRRAMALSRLPNSIGVLTLRDEKRDSSVSDEKKHGGVQ